MEIKRKTESPSPPLSFAVQAQFVNRSVFVFACGLNVVQSERIRSVSVVPDVPGRRVGGSRSRVNDENPPRI